MKGSHGIKIGIALMIMCLMAVHCVDPNKPRFIITSPDPDAVLISAALPSAVDVELSVPVPGCGGTGPAIAPATFLAELALLRDGIEESRVDVTADFSEGVLDPATSAYGFTGTVALSDFGDYQLWFTIENVNGLVGASILAFRLEQEVSEFPGGTYTMRISGLGQDPASCLLSNALLPIITPILGGIPFSLTLPSGADILASGNNFQLDIALPFLGYIETYLSLDETENDILIDGPDEYTIDLSTLPVPLPGFDCIVTAAADGIFDDVDPNDPDGSLTVSIAPGAVQVSHECYDGGVPTEVACFPADPVQCEPGETCEPDADAVCSLAGLPATDCDLIVAMDAS